MTVQVVSFIYAFWIHMSNTSLVITRKKKGQSFVYEEINRPIEDKELVDWINKMAIPPAWRDVKISRSPRSKIYAIGYDAAGNIQPFFSC
jgi:DNA topoisomerase-1